MTQQVLEGLIIGLPFSVVAAIFVFLLSYREYSHHFSDKRKTLKLSFDSAIFAFLSFIVLSLVIGVVLGRIFK
jgi:MFS superfamily sulfate permease-like transporter